MEKNFNHQKFVILATPRTGSNFLANLLGNHNNIKFFGELFDLGGLSKEIMIEALKDPLMYLKNRIYKTYPPHIKAVGFKIFYHQATRDALYLSSSNKLTKDIAGELGKRILNFYQYAQSNFDLENLGQKLEGVWTYLKHDLELKIVHLKRKNILQTILSLKRAFLTNKWIRLAEDPPQDQIPIYLDYDYCCKIFQEIRAREQKYDSFFQSHKKIEVIYENLCKDSNRVTKIILDFLGLQQRVLKSSLKKQDDQPLSETISNYWELKEKFRNTCWIGFFED